MGNEEVGVFMGNGSEVEFVNKGSKECRFIFMAGLPLGEPVAQHGPFVMNTDDELELTIRDFQRGKNGFEGAPGWKSKIRYMSHDVHWRPDK